MATNKIVYGNRILIDLTEDTVSADKLLENTTAHDRSGNIITGTIETKSSDDLIVDGATINVPKGYYSTQASKSVSIITQATPSISVSSSGLITATSTQSAGYVVAGTKSATKQLSTKSATTYTPTTTDLTISSGSYLIGDQTIKGDSNLVPENIKSGVSIFGVVGTCVGETPTNDKTYVIIENESQLPNDVNDGTLALMSDYSKLYMRINNNNWIVIMSSDICSNITNEYPIQVDNKLKVTQVYCVEQKERKVIWDNETYLLNSVYGVAQYSNMLEIDNPTLTINSMYSVKQNNEILEVE